MSIFNYFHIPAGLDDLRIPAPTMTSKSCRWELNPREWVLQLARKVQSPQRAFVKRRGKINWGLTQIFYSSPIIAARTFHS